MKYEKKAPCDSCPFRKDSMRGYTGPYPSAKDMVIAATRMPYACHQGPGKGNPIHEDATHCYGAAVLAQKSAAVSRVPECAEYQAKVGGEDPRIMDMWEAEDWHNKEKIRADLATAVEKLMKKDDS